MLECTLQKRRLRWLGCVQRMENVSRAGQALHWIPAEKRKTEDNMERHNNEGHQPDECDVGQNLPAAMNRQEWRVWTTQCASQWKH